MLAKALQYFVYLYRPKKPVLNNIRHKMSVDLLLKSIRFFPALTFMKKSIKTFWAACLFFCNTIATGQ